MQVIVSQNSKSIGRLLNPRVDIQALPEALAPSSCASVPIQLITLEYDSWQPCTPDSVPATATAAALAPAAAATATAAGAAAAASPAAAAAGGGGVGGGGGGGRRARPLCIGLDDDFRDSQFRLQIIGILGRQAFALPFPHHFCGRSVSAAVSQVGGWVGGCARVWFAVG